jgi:hypothetical protein
MLLWFECVPQSLYVWTLMPQHSSVWDMGKNFSPASSPPHRTGLVIMRLVIKKVYPSCALSFCTHPLPSLFYPESKQHESLIACVCLILDFPAFRNMSYIFFIKFPRLSYSVIETENILRHVPSCPWRGLCWLSSGSIKMGMGFFINSPCYQPPLENDQPI